jgi:hypothetical protein
MKMIITLVILSALTTLCWGATCKATQDYTITVENLGGVNQTNLDQFKCSAGDTLWVFGFDGSANDGVGALSVYKIGKETKHWEYPISFEIPWTYTGTVWSFTQTDLKGLACSNCNPVTQYTYLMGTLTFDIENK